jgi:hypothetical protein
MSRLTARKSMSADDGASLLIVLIVVGVLGILLAALSTFGATAEIDTLSLGDQAGTVYGAGNGISAAIKGALKDPNNWGVASSATDSGSCPTLTLPAAGTSPAMTVSCHYWAGSGYNLVIPPGPPSFITTRPPNSPHYAILAPRARRASASAATASAAPARAPCRSTDRFVRTPRPCH